MNVVLIYFILYIGQKKYTKAKIPFKKKFVLTWTRFQVVRNLQILLFSYNSTVRIKEFQAWHCICHSACQLRYTSVFAHHTRTNYLLYHCWQLFHLLHFFPPVIGVLTWYLWLNVALKWNTKTEQFPDVINNFVWTEKEHSQTTVCFIARFYYPSLSIHQRQMMSRGMFRKPDF